MKLGKLYTIMSLMVLAATGCTSVMGMHKTLMPVIIRVQQPERVMRKAVEAAVVSGSPQKCIEAAKLITRDNLLSVDDDALVRLLSYGGEQAALQIASCVTKDNVVSLDNNFLLNLIWHGREQVALQIASYVTKDNVMAESLEWVMVCLLAYGGEQAALQIASCVTKDNVMSLGKWFLLNLLSYGREQVNYDREQVALQIASCVTKDNVMAESLQCVMADLLRFPSAQKIIAEFCPLVLNDHHALDVYAFDPEKGGTQLMVANRFGQKSPIIITTPSYQSFAINSGNIMQKFDQKLKADITNRLSFYTILKQEKVIIERGNYPIAHGRSTKYDRYVIDLVFSYMQDICYGKEIDKTCHYTQHYAFPGEIWADLKPGNPCYAFRGKPINLPEKNVAALVKNGITSRRAYSYERSTLQFGSNFLGTKHGSSALSYTLSNGNVDEKRGATTIETLFGRLGKALGKDVSKYYKKYEQIFKQLCETAENFQHGTMLVYEFTPQALQNYVNVTGSSGGHIDSQHSGLKIKGVTTTDPKVVLDTLIHNPQDFDDPKNCYEYFWPLTDEVTANPFSEDVKTYEFHIGKHDEKLAGSIQHSIAQLFERIVDEMVKDGVIKRPERSVHRQSKL